MKLLAHVKVFVKRPLPAQLFLTMKLAAIILLTTALHVNARGFAQSISISAKSITLNEVFKEVERQTSFSFLWNEKEFNKDQKISISVKDADINKVLTICLKDQPVTYRIVDKVVMIEKVKEPAPKVVITSPPSSLEVRGRVLNEAGEPVSGVSVTVKGTSKGTSTNEQGEFEIAGLDEKAVLVFSSVSLETIEVAVNGRQSIAVTLKKSIVELQQTVVTALGIKRDKRNLTYSTQEIKGAELTRTKEPSVLNALAGKVSGVQITSSSGAPGASTRIVVRGATSALGDNEALIVLDGIPINNAETGAVGAGAGSSRLIDIDPATIENINVLKGAAATALYGAAGARGVVIITTKGGGIDRKPVLSFTTGISADKGIFPEFQNKYAQGINGVYQDGDRVKQSAAWGPLMDTLKVNGAPAPRFNPIDMFFRTGLTNNHTVSLSGGNSRSGYFMSYSYFDQKGIVPESYFKRHSVFVKYNSQITEKLSSTFQLTYTNSKQRRTPEGVTFGQAGPIFVTYNQPISWNPFPIFSADGKQRVFRTARNNPYWDLENVYNQYLVNRFIPVMTLTYQFNKWLSLSNRAGADIFAEQDVYKEAPSGALNTAGRLVNNNINFRQFNNDLILTANKQFGDFYVNLIAGNNIYSTYTQRNNIEGVGLPVNNFDNISAASTVTASSKYYLQRKVGFYAQANVDYKKFLSLAVTGRYDGSSVLASDNAFYPYGSVAGSFVFSELLPGIKSVMPFGKLRVSYATVGNDNVGVYSLNTPFTAATINNIRFPYMGQSGFLLSSILGNPNLKNERLNEFEVGLETRLVNNRIGLEVSYFKRKSVDGIIPGVSISAASGFDGTTVNSAQITNKGIEVLLNAAVIKTNDFNWNLTTSFTRIRNNVDALYGDLTSLGRIIVGQPYNIFFGSRFQRNAEGKVMVGANGLPIVDATPGIIGDANPDWLAGITNTFTYKNLSLNFFVDIKKGGDIFNSTELNNYFFGTAKSTEDRSPIVYDGISVVDNKQNKVEVKAQDLYRYYSDINEPAMQDATYIKLRNVSLSYNLDKLFSKRSFVKSAAVTLTGRNLWIHAPHFTSGDPEGSTNGSSNEDQGYYGYAYPSTRSYNITLRFDF
ncbi:SusC/RagA family TonB-linked outer membrane protein [Terrimonas sp. NA20]|uniref:SusC/RagA family TonB-linked outer membrane protein n=1 Tax=Terrimonas ginsenosidimutans TaxID=2908004 RepID=A0ABS9KSZ4_9BACT|nr:SusC/RagA family TonB-linked outer membrane protein [Terrimonas ginsenosidimutans]MCG2615455.1 SusC/RagA family TonB-linked outer membrane protein [Terrimonas ginsenosidimutans]